MNRLAAALIVVCAVLIVAALGARLRESPDKSTFWTQYGGAVPPYEQVRRFSAAERGVPDTPWAEAYWPPRYCVDPA